MWTMFSLQLTVRCTCIANEADASRSLTETKGRHADEHLGCKSITAHAGSMNYVRSADRKGRSTHADTIKRKEVLATTSIHLYCILLLKKGA